MNPGDADDWVQALTRLQQQFATALTAAGTPPLPGFIGAGQPFAAPPAVTGSLPFDLFGAQQTTGAVWPGAVPAVPPTDSAEAKRWADALKRWQETLNALQQTWLEITAETWEHLRTALTAADAPQDLRGVYDLWVACAESVYNRHALSERYAGLVSDLINVQVDLQFLVGLGAAPEADPQELKEELAAAREREAALRRELAALRAETGPKNKPAPATIPHRASADDAQPKVKKKSSKAAATAKTGRSKRGKRS